MYPTVENVDTILASQPVIEIVVTESILAAEDPGLFSAPVEGRVKI